MKIWIYKDKTQQGPFTLEELEQMDITMETKVWFSGLPKWYPAGTVPELAPLFNKAQAPELPEVPADAAGGEQGAAGADAGDECACGQAQEEVAGPMATAAPEPVMAQECYMQPMPQYQEPVQAAAPPKCPPSYIVWTVLLLVLCCSPFAVASLVTGILTMTRYNSGNFASAKKFSDATAWLVMLGFALGPVANMMMSALMMMF